MTFELMKALRPAGVLTVAGVLLLVPAAAALAESEGIRPIDVLAPEAAPVNSSVTRQIVASVHRDDGSPVKHALVFTSAGGLGISDASGQVRFPVEFGLEAKAVHVTATTTEAGVSAAGRVRVDIDDRRGAVVDAGVIMLATEVECEPAWIPTFGEGSGLNSWVRALATFDDGSGPALYAGGILTTAGGQVVNHIARWDGAAWSPLGSGMNDTVRALAVFDDGTGPALYAGGDFFTAGDVVANNIAKWDGTAWSAVGTCVPCGGTNGFVAALTVFDDGDGPALYAGGGFTSTVGGLEANHIAKWDGTVWSALGSGLDNWVRVLTVFDDGDGAALYAGGDFGAAGKVATSHIAKWDGAAWSDVGGGTNGVVSTLTVFDDGSGPALFVAGGFSVAGDEDTIRIAKWDGADWSPLGSGMDNNVFALSVYDDGTGSALYAGGIFGTAGGVAASRVAKWDGTAWSPLDSGANSFVLAMGTFDDGDGNALYVGGSFTIAGDIAANYIAKWLGCPIPCAPADLNCDGVVDGADLGLLLSAWGPCDMCVADLNGDGLVDGADLGILLAAWTI